MNHHLTRFFASLGLVLGALSFLPAANAALVEYTFVVTPDSGPLSAQSFGGSFSYDDAVTPGVGFLAAKTCSHSAAFRSASTAPPTA